MSAIQIFPTAEEWQSKRVNQIGASEVATIAGVSKYGNIVDLWKQKTTKEQEPINNEAMLWGHVFEDGVARMFEEKTGLQVIKSSIGDWQFVREGAEWMSCSPDRTYWLDKDAKHNARDWSQKGLLECKTTVVDPEEPNNEWMLRSWYCQVQWQLLVAEMKEAHLCCCVFGFDRKTVIRHWPANPEFQAKLLALVTKFWEHNVLGNVAPDPQKKEDVDALFPTEVKGQYAEADDEVNQACIDLKLLKDNIKMMEEKAADLQSKIILAIGENEGLKKDGVVLATYKAPKASSKFNSDAFKTENADLYAKYCYESQSARRFLLK